MKKNNLLMLMLFSVSFVACSDDDDESPLAIEKEVEIDATAYDKWVYFSFKTGAVVGTSAVDENRDKLDWDIAFHRWDIRTNGETGKGGVHVAEGKIAKTGWDALIEAPTTNYKADGKISVTVATRPKYVFKEVSGCEVITGSMKGTGTWMNMSHLGGGKMSYEYSNQIFVVKTAEGKYAKVWLKGYTKLVDGRKKGGYITMKYAYQEDGSTKLN
jgi:hypothetical protein